MGIKHLSTIELNAFNHFNFLFVNRKLDLLDFYFLFDFLKDNMLTLPGNFKSHKVGPPHGPRYGAGY